MLSFNIHSQDVVIESTAGYCIFIKRRLYLLQNVEHIKNMRMPFVLDEKRYRQSFGRDIQQCGKCFVECHDICDYHKKVAWYFQNLYYTHRVWYDYVKAVKFSKICLNYQLSLRCMTWIHTLTNHEQVILDNTNDKKNL